MTSRRKTCAPIRRTALPKLHGALLKNEQDVHLFERLAFMPEDSNRHTAAAELSLLWTVADGRAGGQFSARPSGGIRCLRSLYAARAVGPRRLEAPLDRLSDLLRDQAAEEVYALTWKRLFTEGEFEPKGFIATLDGKAVGLTHYLYHRSGWSEKNNCFLQDLFRGPGCARQGDRRRTDRGGETGSREDRRQECLLDDARDQRHGPKALRPRCARTGFIEYDLL